MKIKERFASIRKRYGWGGLFRNAGSKLLGLVGMHASRWHLYALRQSKSDIGNLNWERSGHPFRELSLEDFHRQALLNPEWFTPGKMADMEKGLAIEGNHAYGLYEGELLICYGWISLKCFGLNPTPLLPTDAYLWDAYTHPAFRGRRLHTDLSHYCIQRAFGYGKLRVVVIVADYNRASSQTYKWLGFRLTDTFWRYSLGQGRERTTMHYKRLPACTDVIVVGGSHYNTLWVIRSLGMAGYRPTVIVVCENKKSFVTYSQYINHSFMVRTDEEMVDLLRNKLHFGSKTMIFTSSDSAAACLDRHFDDLSTHYYLFNCAGRAGKLSHWMNKDVMVDLAAKSGFTIPQSERVDLEYITDDIFDRQSFPCIVKPLKSSEGHKTDFRICNNSTSLRKVFSELKSTCRYIQVQQYIQPDYEISVLCFRHRPSGVCAIPGLLYKLGTCQSVYNLGMPTYTRVRHSLTPLVNEDVIRRFTEEIDYHGLYSIEFFVKDDVAYFLEINLRVDGDLFVYTSAGCNMPRLFMELTQDSRIVPAEEQLHISKEVTGMTEISFVKYTWRHPLRMLRVWWKTDCYSIFSWKDPLPFIFKFIHP